MKRALARPSLFLNHALLAVFLWVLLWVPNARSVAEPSALLVGVAVIEVVYLAQLTRMSVKRASSGASPIMVIVWAFFIVWELATTKTNSLSVLVHPSPETVFNVFPEQWDTMPYNAAYSLELIVLGFVGDVFSGALAGIVVGWFSPLRMICHPIAKVLAPIPPMILAPYIVRIMPTFRSASVVLVGITVFMFVLIQTIERVNSLDEEITDSIKILNLNGFDVIKNILVPYILPEVIAGLKIYVIMGFMMLMYAESLDSPYGLGHWIMVNYTYTNYGNLLAGFIEIGVIVIALNKIVEIVQEKAIRWR